MIDITAHVLRCTSFVTACLFLLVDKTYCCNKAIKGYESWNLQYLQVCKINIFTLEFNNFQDRCLLSKDGVEVFFFLLFFFSFFTFLAGIFAFSTLSIPDKEGVWFYWFISLLLHFSQFGIVL